MGAIIDAFVAVQLLLPDFWIDFNGLTAASNATLNYALVTASALMWGWTLLLIWADRNPLQRKSILLLTAFPVVFGLALNNAYAAATGLRTLESTVPTLILQAVLAALFILAT
jgi:hypothetical protein